MKAEKGSITVMLILVLCAIIMAVTLVVEVARIKIAEGQAKRAVDTALFSALSTYDQDTKDDYGLFYRYGEEGLDQQIQDEIEKTLLINDGSSAWHPYEFHIKSMEVRVLFPLNDKESIKHQILEYMKYRGPAELADDVMEKLGAFFSMQSTSRVMAEDMKVDKILKRMVKEIEALKKELTVIEGLSPEKHSTLCREAQNWSSLFSEIEELEYDIEMLEERADNNSSGDSKDSPNQLDVKREELNSKKEDVKANAEVVYDQLKPIVTAHENAIKSCERLKTITPEAEAAIKRADKKMNDEKGVMTTVKTDLEKKYKEYEKYVSRKDLSNLESALTGNLAVIKPQLKALERIKNSSDKPDDYPGVFSRSGYQSCGFEPGPFPGAVDAPATSLVLDWGFIKDLIDELGSLKDEIKTLANTADDQKEGITKCPGGGSGEETQDTSAPMADDPYDQANDTVGGAYDKIGGDSRDSGGFDGGSLIEGLTQSAASLSKDAYDALLINEYVLKTFNKRINEDGELHDKHHLAETEVEYILIGSSSPSTNAFLAQSEILAWRTVFNAISFTVYCKEVSSVIDEASVALNAATGIPYPLWKGTLTGLFALMESCLDVMRMYAGNDIPMFKYTISDLSIVQRFQEILDRLGAPKKSLNKTGNGATSTKTTLEADGKVVGKDKDGKNIMVDYEDHLRAILLYRAMSGQGDTILYRIQDLVYTNIQKIRGDYDPSIHFNFIEADVQFTIKSFFPNLSGINAQIDGIPMRHTISVECGRGY